MHMTDITICYGMTETSPVSFQSSPEDSIQQRVTTIGRVHPHVEAKVIDPATGHILPRGQTGKLKYNRRTASSYSVCQDECLETDRFNQLHIQALAARQL